MDIYLVMNTDYDGDLITMVITKEVFDWINSPWKGGKGISDYNDLMPTSVVTWEDAEADFDADGTPRSANITIGSWQNDRALMVNSNVEGYKPYYNDIVEFFHHLRLHGDSVADVFEGMVY